jgi:hypothetical protein
MDLIDRLREYASTRKGELAELITEAADALERQTCEDAVSRQAAIDAIGTWDKFGVDERCRIVRWHEGLEPYVHLRDVVTAIANLPSAQPEEQKEMKVMISNEKAYLMWQYCKDPNDIDKAIATHDEAWAGLESLHQIISITYDPNHSSYVVFWRAYREE